MVRPQFSMDQYPFRIKLSVCQGSHVIQRKLLARRRIELAIGRIILQHVNSVAVAAVDAGRIACTLCVSFGLLQRSLSQLCPLPLLALSGWIKHGALLPIRPETRDLVRPVSRIRIRSDAGKNKRYTCKVGVRGLVVECRTRNFQVPISNLTAGHLQETLSKLLTYGVLRSTQPSTLRGTGNE